MARQPRHSLGQIEAGPIACGMLPPPTAAVVFLSEHAKVVYRDKMPSRCDRDIPASKCAIHRGRK